MAKSVSHKGSPLQKTKKRKTGFCINSANSELVAYKNHLYEVYKPKRNTLDTRHLKSIFSAYEVILSHYAKVFVCRIDLHPRQRANTNSPIEDFLCVMNNTLAAKYQSKIIYHCAREQDTSDKEHYHLQVMLSGHKIRHPAALLNLLKSLWHAHTGGTVSLVDNPYCHIRRGNKASLRDAIYRSSYLAKKHTKEKNGNLKGLISNRLKPAANFDDNRDLMLVDPDITFRHNQRAEQRKQMARFENTYQTSRNTPQARRTQNGWFNLLSHMQQLKACIASFSESFTHLNPYPNSNVINGQTDVVINRSAPHEPKIDHSLFDQYKHQ